MVGNAEDVEKDDELLPIMFIGYPSNPNYTVDEKYLKHLAEKYGGPVKALQYRKADPQLRTYVLIEFYDLQHTKRSRRKFCQNKVNFLGDQKCDVSILSLLPNKQINPSIPPYPIIPQS